MPFLKVLAAEAGRDAEALHCVVHGGTIMAVMSALADPVRPYFDWTADFCGGYLLVCDNAPGGGARPLKLIEPIRPKRRSGEP